MAGWNNHSYLFTQQTPQLTFNGCSLCSVSKCPGGFDFHYGSLLLFSFGLHEDVGFCITDEGTLRFAGLRVFLSHCKDAQQMLYAFPNSYLLYILET